MFCVTLFVYNRINYLQKLHLAHLVYVIKILMKFISSHLPPKENKKQSCKTSLGKFQLKI